MNQLIEPECDEVISDRWISKTGFLAGLQCPKLLWCRYNSQQLFPSVDPMTQSRFDQGREVGLLARALYPGGRAVVDSQSDLDQALMETRQAVLERRPLCEAAFTYASGLVRIDILNPLGRDQWELVEVKSEVEMKAVNLQYVAFQAFVLAGSGLGVRRCTLVHLDRSYVRHGGLDPRQLFVRRDVTLHAVELARSINEGLGEMQKTVRHRTCPETAIGAHCDTPYQCPLRDQCWAFLPEHSILELYRGRAMGFALLGREVTPLTGIPEDCSLTENQRLQVKTVRSARPRVSKLAIRRFLQDLKYPVHFLDFETFSTAILKFDGLRPFQRVPFQFSLQIQASPGADLVHREFLAHGAGDPRPDFMTRLREVVAQEGSPVAYNAAFEKGVLRECADALPVFRPWVESLKPRFVGLLQQFRAFRYYHPAQHGSASMKTVLPALTGRGYEDLAIRDGDTASWQYLRVTFGNSELTERDRIYHQLEEYCGLDTEGMWQIISALRNLV